MPDEVVVLRRLGEAALFERQYLEAIAALERALEIEPDDIGTLLDLGLSRLGANREDQAHLVLERFVSAIRQLSPDESAKMMTLTNDYLAKLVRRQPEMAARVSMLNTGGS
jgi:Flp pilus assembly protein TadD